MIDADVIRLLRWRRDVRHFKATPLTAAILDELIAAADLAPSVGLSQPWRFVLVEDAGRKAGVRAVFERCNREALAGQDRDRATSYAGLKLAGLDQAPCQMAVFLDEAATQGHGLGRETMPETLAYSTVMAIHTLWLAARSVGIGMGWVSILDPKAIAAILEVPSSWRLVGYLCLGYPAEDSDVPELERTGWELRRPARLLRR